MVEKNNLKEEMEGKIIVSPVINSVPLSFWKEFKADAEKNFSNNYCMKIISNHHQATNIRKIEELEERVTYLETVIVSMPVKEMEEKINNSLPTFGKR